MDYWTEAMQDDCYFIAADGWVANTQRIIEINKKTGKASDKGWTCDLLPKPLIVARYFADDQATIEAQQAELDTVAAQLTELEEEHCGEEGAFAELEKINKGEVAKRLKLMKSMAGQVSREAGTQGATEDDPEYAGEVNVLSLRQWILAL